MDQTTKRETSSDGSFESANEEIAFAIYSVDEKSEKRQLRFDERLTSGAYRRKREIAKRFQLSAGAYVIVPSVQEECKQLRYMLRVFLEEEADSSLNSSFALQPSSESTQTTSSSDEQQKNKPSKKSSSVAYRQTTSSRACSIL